MRAVRKSVPDGPRARYEAIFRLCRRLLSLEDPAPKPVNFWKPWFRKWHELALPFIQTKSFDESWADFCRIKPRVRTPLNDDFLASAMGIIDPDVIKKAFPEYESDAVLGIIAICVGLHLYFADTEQEGIFFLGCRNAGELIGQSHKQASDYLHMLVADGVLQLVEKGTPPRRASRYRLLRPILIDEEMTREEAEPTGVEHVVSPG